MTNIKKALIIASIPVVLGLAGNYIKNKFDIFSDDINDAKKVLTAQQILTQQLESQQEEMKRYVELNLKLTNDKIKLQRKYSDEIARVNNERFDKISLYSKPGNSDIIIHTGMLDILQNISSSQYK